MGPEDLLGGNYALWQYGGNQNPTHKNLQYLQNISKDDEAFDAIDFFCIHGYGADGINAGVANSSYWEQWKNGWEKSPAQGIPDNIKGYADFGKKSWMTETSGENKEWLSPSNGFPGYGAWSIGLRIHQALTNGDQSAWVYWTFVDTDGNGDVSNHGLTSKRLGSASPKYVAAKHFFNPIRPNSIRVSSKVSVGDSILASAYLNYINNTLVIVVLNTSQNIKEILLKLPDFSKKDFEAITYLSCESCYWKRNAINIRQGVAESVLLPAYSIMSMVIVMDNINIP